MSTTQRGTLPSGRAPASSIPSYLTNPDLTSSANDSTGSNDSFKSQIPLPFHMAEDSSDYPPRNNLYQHQAVSPTRNSNDSNAGMLNPNSRPYVPSPLMTHGFQSHLPQQGSSGNGGYGHGHPVAQEPNYQHHYGYGHGQGGYSANTAQPQFGGYGNAPDPYGHYGVPPTMSSQATYGGSMTSTQSHGQGQGQGGWAAQYYSTSTSPASQSHDYNMMSSSQTSFQSVPFSNVSGNGYAAAQGSGPGYMSPYINPQQQVPYSNNTFQPNPLNMHHNNNGPSHSERIFQQNNGYGSARKNEYDDKHHTQHHSNGTLANQNNQHSTAYGNGQNNGRTQSRVKSNGPMLPPQPRNEHQGVVARFKSPDSVSENAPHHNNNFSRNGQKGQAQDSGAENQYKTPQLRSRRNQSITDPPRTDKKQLGTWLNTVPAMNMESLNLRETVGNSGGGRNRSPPRLLNALATLAESDPFATPQRALALCNNPFAPASTALTTVRAANMMGAQAQAQEMSIQWKKLTNNGTRMPTVDEALNQANLPFTEYCRNSGPDNHGVIRIRNIPYGVGRQEIMAFLGRNARIINEFDNEPVHIVMERVTSKTLDCFVEFINFNEALNAVNRFTTSRDGGRGGRLGSRHVDVELSSQDQLMKELFPKAKNVEWQNGRPVITPTDPDDKYNSGFAGFVSKEELVMLVKHVEAPQRSPFSKDCPQRPYECLISTLFKLPWYMVDYITIDDRNRLHGAAKQLLTLLMNYVTNNREDTRLTGALLKRCWRAVLACPGFTPSMKDDICCICEVDIKFAEELGLAPYAADWRYLWTIGPKRGVAQDVLMLYIDWIRNITVQQKPQLTLAEQAAQGDNTPANENKLFGDLDKTIKYPPCLAQQTLKTVAECEWAAIESALRRALTPALQS